MMCDIFKKFAEYNLADTDGKNLKQKEKNLNSIVKKYDKQAGKRYDTSELYSATEKKLKELNFAGKSEAAILINMIYCREYEDKYKSEELYNYLRNIYLESVLFNIDGYDGEHRPPENDYNENETIKKVQLLEWKHLQPYLFKNFADGSSPIPEEFYKLETHENILQTARNSYNHMRFFIRYALQLLTLYKLIKKIQNAEMDLSKYSELITNYLKELIKLSDNLSDFIDVENIFDPVEFQRFENFIQRLITNGELEFYDTDLNKYSDKIVGEIISSDMKNLSDLNKYGERFFKETYIERELQKAEKYQYYRENYTNKERLLGTIIGNLFIDISQSEK